MVSVIIPCYNYGWSLPETLDSLLAQTYLDWECLVVDDGSIDDSKKVVEDYAGRDTRFKYIYQNNQGISAARNHGIRFSQGKYIQFLDADDLLCPNKLKMQVAFLDKQPLIDLVYSDVRYFRHGEPDLLSRSFNMLDEKWMAEAQGKGKLLINALVKKNIMVMNAPLLRSTLEKKVGGFTEGLHYMEDWEFWLRCGIAGATFHYDGNEDARAMVRVHPKSTSQNVLKMYKNEIIVRQKTSLCLLILKLMKH